MMMTQLRYWNGWGRWEQDQRAELLAKIKWAMTGRDWIFYSFVQRYSTVFFIWPFRARLSNLLLRLRTEVTRETFCLPGPFLTCNWWWQQTIALFLYSKLVLAARAKSQEPWEQGALWKGWKWIISSQYRRSHQELPVTIWFLVCSWDNTDVVCLSRNHFHDQIYHWRK